LLLFNRIGRKLSAVIKYPDQTIDVFVSDLVEEIAITGDLVGKD